MPPVDPLAWAWPQWLMAAALTAHLGLNWLQHGKPMLSSDPEHAGRPARYSAPRALILAAAVALVLACGGFWS